MAESEERQDESGEKPLRGRSRSNVIRINTEFDAEIMQEIRTEAATSRKSIRAILEDRLEESYRRKRKWSETTPVSKTG